VSVTVHVVNILNDVSKKMTKLKKIDEN